MLTRLFDLFSLSPVMLGSSAVSLACGSYLVVKVTTNEMDGGVPVPHDEPSVHVTVQSAGQVAVQRMGMSTTNRFAPRGNPASDIDDDVYYRGDEASSSYGATARATTTSGGSMKRSRPVNLSASPVASQSTDPYSHDEPKEQVTAAISNLSLFTYDASATSGETPSVSSAPTVSSSTRSSTAESSAETTDFITSSPSDTSALSEDEGSEASIENASPDPQASEFLLTEADVDISIEESQSVRCYAPSNQGGLPCMCELTTVIKGKPFTELINNCN